MPRGDNQHQFTCSNCNGRKPTTDRCPGSLYCKECCNTARACVRICDACSRSYQRCQSGGAGGACDLCALHMCNTAGSYAIYRCRCRTCSGCNVRQLIGVFYEHAPADHPCFTCHQNMPTCQHCARCGNTDDACSCERRPAYSEMPMDRQPDGSLVPKMVLSGPTQFKFNPLKRTIGLELEYSKCGNGAHVERAMRDIGGAIVADGTAFFELNTPPMNGDRFVHGMAYLSEMLQKAKAKVSDRVAMHVHIGCMDYEWADMRHLVMLYGRLESGIYSIIDPKRITGGFSHPNGGRSLVSVLRNPVTAREDLIRMTYKQEKTRNSVNLWSGKSPPGGNGRYWGMNLHSWFYRGTVEFRMHHGTSRWEKMVAFPMLLASMCDAALAIPERNIVDFPQGREGLLQIAPTQWVRDWVKERWDYFAARRKDKSEPIADF